MFKFFYYFQVRKQFVYPQGNFTLYVCFVNSLHPKSRGTIKLNTTNPYDAPLIDPNYYENPEDIRPIAEGNSLNKLLYTIQDKLKYTIQGKLKYTTQKKFKKIDVLRRSDKGYSRYAFI